MQVLNELFHLMHCPSVSLTARRIQRKVRIEADRLARTTRLIGAHADDC